MLLGNRLTGSNRNLKLPWLKQDPCLFLGRQGAQCRTDILRCSLPRWFCSSYDTASASGCKVAGYSHPHHFSATGKGKRKFQCNDPPFKEMTWKSHTSRLSRGVTFAAQKAGNVPSWGCVINEMKHREDTERFYKYMIYTNTIYIKYSYCLC